MDYLITMRGHMEMTKCPRDLPHIALQVFILQDVTSKKSLTDTIQQYLNTVLVMGGMLVRDDPYGVLDPSKLDIKRKWIPMHMFAYIDCDVKDITSKAPRLNADGSLSLEEGEEPPLLQ